MSLPPTHLGDTDRSGRGPLCVLLGSAALWLVAGGLLSIISTAQLISPGFLADWPALTHGRTRALQETVFVYGWAANAGFAVAIWILGRLSGAPLRACGLATVGALFWNLALTGGLICIAAGEMTSIPFLQIPRYLHPLLLFSYAAIATPGVLAWTGRRQRATYAAQWYAVGALFLFPWFYSAAQVMLLVAPMHGVGHSVAATWIAQNFQTCLFFPIALAAAYYLIPKTTGRLVDHYDFAVHGFWTLIAFGSWTGTRHLVGGPVPVWIPVVGIVATQMLIFHFVVVILNLHFGMHGGKDAVARFVSMGLILYVVNGFLDAIFSFQGLAESLQFTYFTVAQLKLGVYGGFSFLVFGAIYYLVPRYTGFEWPNPSLIRAHYGLALSGVVLTVAGLAVAGWAQGHALMDAGQTFTSIAAKSRPGLVAALIGEGLFLLGGLVLTLNFFKLQVAANCQSRVAAVSTLEASTP